MKESQGLARVLDTLVFAYEFIMLPTPSEQAEGLEALRRTMLRLQPDLKVGPACWSMLLQAFGRFLLTAFLGPATHGRPGVFCMLGYGKAIVTATVQKAGRKLGIFLNAKSPYYQNTRIWFWVEHLAREGRQVYVRMWAELFLLKLDCLLGEASVLEAQAFHREV